MPELHGPQRLRGDGGQRPLRPPGGLDRGHPRRLTLRAGGPLLLLSALEGELLPVAKELGLKGSLRGLPAPAVVYRPRPDLLIGWTGMGPEPTRRTLRALADGVRPAWVCHLGVAGGILPSAPTGSVFRCDRAYAHPQGDVQEALPPPADRLPDLAALLAAFPGTATVSSEVVVGEVADKQALAERYPGAALVEMETFWALQSCREHDLGLTVLRAVCDHAEQTLPDLGEAIDLLGRPRPLHMAKKLARRPWLAAELPQVGRSFSAAQDALQTAARSLIRAWERRAVSARY